MHVPGRCRLPFAFSASPTYRRNRMPKETASRLMTLQSRIRRWDRTGGERCHHHLETHDEVCVSSFLFVQSRQQTQPPLAPPPPPETNLSRDRWYTAGCIPYRAAVLIRAQHRNEGEETPGFQKDIFFRACLPPQLMKMDSGGIYGAPRWVGVVLHQHFVSSRGVAHAACLPRGYLLPFSPRTYFLLVDEVLGVAAGPSPCRGEKARGQKEK
ncbi:hypothetical protein QBC39DRAFT_52562 [Podospora conica]|nr:hypothetical protein QBC39DRAFT_52562 [Schizothecium conicum]